MRRAALLGVPDTKRTQYLRQAARQAGLPLLFLDWKNWQEPISCFPEDGLFMKIDPPVWDSCALKELENLTENYKRQLKELACAAEESDIRFLNPPSAIAALLDKRACKETLSEAGLPVTEALELPSPGSRTVSNAEQLFHLMKNQRAHQVFIKPLNGSGAAGVSAFRRQPSTGRMALYTCAADHPEKGLVNTGRLRCFSAPEQIIPLLNQLLQMECLIERWHAKAEYHNFSYDLRAVAQNGRLDYLLARLSRGPITNLQLNNRPLDIRMLNLPWSVMEEITEICLKAMEVYPQLFSAGIDILLEKGSLKPRIIEMNGQGDLIYQDIYQENIIYRRQAEFMLAVTKTCQ